MYALGDGRFSSGLHLCPPRAEDAPAEHDLHAGRRVWWFRLGEWVEVMVYPLLGQEKRAIPGCSFKVREVACQGDWMHKVSARDLALEQPADCGRMLPPQGAAGKRTWMERDPRVFDTHSEWLLRMQRNAE